MKPQVEVAGERILVSWPGQRVGFVFDRLRDSGGDTYAEIAAHYWEHGSPDGLLTLMKANLLGARTPAEVGKRCAERDSSYDWPNLVETACVAALRAHRQGDPFAEAGGTEVAAPEEYMIDKLLPLGKATQWYGAGGSGKGYLAVLAGVCVETGRPFLGEAVQMGRVLYLDWEDDRATLTRRIQRVCAGLSNPPVVFSYRQCTRRLADDIETVTAYVREHGITLVIVDSVTGAGGAISEQGGYELVAQHLMQAVRLLPCTTLLIDHVSDAGRTSKDLIGKSYGSVRKRDLCRSAWEFKADREAGSRVTHIGLYHTKANHSELFRPIGVAMNFDDPEAVRFTLRDVRESATLASATSSVSQMQYALRGGALPLKEWARRIDMKADTVYRLARKHPDIFAQVTQGVRGGDEGTWGLVYGGANG